MVKPNSIVRVTPMIKFVIDKQRKISMKVLIKFSLLTGVLLVTAGLGRDKNKVDPEQIRQLNADIVQLQKENKKLDAELASEKSAKS